MKRYITSIARTMLPVALAMVTLASCIKDDALEPCPKGVNLRFVYDYNMEYANAFPSKVDCVTLYIYDADGNYVATRTETGDVLQDENYRMQIDLEEGTYQFVAYGGLACGEHSFAPTAEPGQGSVRSDLRIAMQGNGETSNVKLHDLFYGSLDVTVEGDFYKEHTLYMMKNTNNVRIILQQLNNQPLASKDFDFRITDDNTLFNYDNSLIPNGTLTYAPWSQGEETVGESEGEDTQVTVAYAELSTSRLMTENHPRLLITASEDGREIVNIPLNDYLLLLKSDLYADMPAQEFLDRESEWSLIFFLDDNNVWLQTVIVINDWVVRLNNIPLS